MTWNVEILNSGFALSGSLLSWSSINWEVIDPGSQLQVWLLQSWLLASPSLFRNWIWWIIKSVWLWFIHNRYWFVGFILLYILVIVVYNYVWWKVVVYFQKKWYEEYLKSQSDWNFNS